MRNIQVTPLLVLFAAQLLSGIYIIFREDTGSEGWQYLASSILCISAFVFLFFDLLLKRYFKNKEQLVLMQFLVAAIVVFMYLLWDLTIFS
ncbi:MAG: hypothetical protein AAF611_22820 [Bacteroidota bacterium]